MSSTPVVQKLLSNLNTSKAAGPDGISAKILKELACEISPILTHILNQSLHTGDIPSDWLDANVMPLFKKGDKLKAENYRPVSLTCIVCKLLEHIIFANVMDHADLHNIMTKFQHGFRTKHSCETQLLLTTHDMTKSYDNKLQVDMIVLDFSKAFDKVPHERLLHKLNHFSIGGKTHKWIRTLLMQRSQSFVLEGSYSSKVHVTSDIPQGTVLQPLLFLLYINDLPDCVSSTARLFADDCVLYRVIESDKDTKQLQVDLDALQEWETKWMMHFNPNKCNVIRFCPKWKETEREYFIHGTKLE